ncbi:MAG: glycosyltransferase family 39 protein [Candidatus Omnitrophota bacterium]
MRKLVAWGLLLGIVAGTIVFNIAFFKNGHFAYVFDENGRIMGSLTLNRIFFSSEPGYWAAKAAPALRLSYFQGHPRLFDACGAFVFQALRSVGLAEVRWLIVAVNALYSLIAAMSVFAIGQLLYSRTAGLTAVFLFLMFPFVGAHTRAFVLDFPLTAMVSLSVWMLLKTRHFSSWRYSLALGLCAALAELTKETAIIFLLPPAVGYFFQARSVTDKRKCLTHAGLALGVAVLLSVVIYLRPENLYAFRHYFGMAVAKDHPSFFFYLLNFENYVGLWLIWVCVPLLAVAAWRFRGKDIALWCWWLVPLIFYSLPPSKWPRYILPIFPAVALLMAGALTAPGRLIMVRRVFLFLVLVVALGQYAAYASGFLKYTPRLQVHAFGYEVGRWTYRDDPALRTGEDLLAVLKKERVSGQPEKLVLCLFNIPEIYGVARREAYLEELPYDIVCATEIFPEALSSWPWKGDPREVLKADYLWFKTGRTPRAYTQSLQDIENGLRRGFAEYRDHFTKVAEVPAPEGTVVEVYKRARQVSQGLGRERSGDAGSRG